MHRERGSRCSAFRRRGGGMSGVRPGCGSRAIGQTVGIGGSALILSELLGWTTADCPPEVAVRDNLHANTVITSELVRGASMSQRTMVPVARVAAAVAFLVAAFGGTSPSEAYVQQIVIDATNTANYNPIPLGSSTPGSSVSYTIYTGRIFGTLSPTNPVDSVITDLNLASPVSGGFSYIATFSILTPTNPAARSGLLIH